MEPAVVEMTKACSRILIREMLSVCLWKCAQIIFPARRARWRRVPYDMRVHLCVILSACFHVDSQRAQAHLHPLHDNISVVSIKTLWLSAGVLRASDA